MATKETDDKTQKAVEATKGATDAQSVASVQTTGKVSDSGGVQAVVNPDRNSQEVAFPTGDGELDIYKAGVTHTVPRSTLR